MGDGGVGVVQPELGQLKLGQEACPEFDSWWERHDIGRTGSGRKTVHHPTKGRLVLEHTSFQANDDPSLKLVIYTPVAG